MIQLSKQADYGIVILTYFARTSDAPLLSAKSVSLGTHLSLPMVSKILKILVKKELLKSYQGVKGGYQLARPATDISIAEIIEGLDGPLALTECSYSSGVCKTESSCSVKPHWAMINVVIREALTKLTLASMAAPVVTMTKSANFFPLLVRQEKK